MVGIPVFADSGYVILVALANSLAKTLRFPPRDDESRPRRRPCRGPITISPRRPALSPPRRLFHVDIGIMILTGVVFSIPMIAAMIWYSIFIGKHIDMPEPVLTGPARR